MNERSTALTQKKTTEAELTELEPFMCKGKLLLRIDYLLTFEVGVSHQ
jgi:hypothetical protein